MWGCFSVEDDGVGIHVVFPTHVGVFLSSAYDGDCYSSLPHACGGVSQFMRTNSNGEASSPRMWGCFQIRLLPCSSAGVFPTHVGVFLVLWT